jgi:hypothetical protein
MENMRRTADLTPYTFDEQTNEIDVIFSAGAIGRRNLDIGPVDEELVVSDASIDLSRIQAGTAHVLDSHKNEELDDIIGVVVRAWVQDNVAMARLRLSVRPEMAGIVADIRAGVIRAISVGYQIQEYELVERQGMVPLMRVTRWMPYEISFVPVPFDGECSTRSAEIVAAAEAPIVAAVEETPEVNKPETDAAPQVEAAITAADVQAAAQRAADVSAEITSLAVRSGIPEKAAELVRKHQTVEAAGLEILNMRAEEQKPAALNVQTVRDETETRLRGIEQAIEARLNPSAKLDDNARQYRGMSLLEIGRTILESAGVATRQMDKFQLSGAVMMHRSGGMMTTSDFANITANVASKRMRSMYAALSPTYKIWARRAANLPDFKSRLAVLMSGAPVLEQTNEAGEFKYGSLSDQGVSYSAVTYGKILPFSRQLLINDDLSAFDKVVTAFGASSARTENNLAYAQLTGNPTMSDSIAMFHASHSNLLTGATSALSQDALNLGRKAMRKQKGLASEPLNLAPKFLIVPTDLEQLAYQLTSPGYFPTVQTAINEFAQGGRTALTPVVDPILDSASTTAWYLLGDGVMAETVEYAYVDGSEGPMIDQEVGFDVDGLKIKCRLDFAVKSVEWRGAVKSNGV